MPMTLRTLKKRSKQALPILQRHFPAHLGVQFSAVRGDNHHGLVIRCTHGSGSPSLKAGRPWCDCARHPLPGTPMAGRMSGYYEPEWEEETTYELLANVLRWSDKPTSMTDVEWKAALRIIGLTPAEHARFLAEIEQEMRDLARDVCLRDAPLEAAHG